MGSIELMGERIGDARALSDLAPAWDDLLARSGSDEPMRSPAWLLPWWEVFGGTQGRVPAVLALREGDRLVGLAPLLRRRVLLGDVVPARRLELIGSGEPERDEICSEYLGLIAERGREAEVAGRFAEAIAGGALGPFDELLLPLVRDDDPMIDQLAAALSACGLAVTREVASLAPFIPLPSTWQAYLDALPRQHRYLLARSLRDFDAWAGAAAREHLATDGESLRRGRAVLRALHAERWHAADRPGAFDSPAFSAFHDRVMPALLAAGQLELRWLEVRGEPIAVLYNLRRGDRVLFYQGGRRLDVPRAIRPGVVLHARAIRHAIEAGRREYDFLGGAARYKTQLSLGARQLIRLRAARPSVVEAAARVVDRGRRALRPWWRALRSRHDEKSPVAQDSPRAQ